MNVLDISSFIFFPVMATFFSTGGAILASSVIGAGASIYGAKKAAKAAKSVQPVNVAQLAADARANAETNLRRSLELEQQYLPGQASARTGLKQSLAQIFSPGSQEARSTALAGMLGLAKRGGVSDLTRTAADKLLADLNLGGRLDPETQAAVVRGALSGAGGAGILGSQAGRGITARDLGLTSLQLQNARRQSALQAGNQLERAELLSLAGLQDLLSNQSAEALNSSKTLSGMLPEAGLSAGDLASVTVGNVNQQNQARLAASQASTAGTQGALKSLSQGLNMFARQAGTGNDGGDGFPEPAMQYGVSRWGTNPFASPTYLQDLGIMNSSGNFNWTGQPGR